MDKATRFREEVLAGYEKPEDLLGQGRLLEQLTKALVGRALGAELSHHLGSVKLELTVLQIVMISKELEMQVQHRFLFGEGERLANQPAHALA